MEAVQLPETHPTSLTRLPGALCYLLVSTVAVAAAGQTDNDEPAIDKSGFHLFKPTPAEYVRDLTIDGPCATESPYTVDAGHFQFEMALVSYTTDRATFDGVTERFEAWAVAPVTLKVGLLNQLDAQLVLETYNLVYEREDGTRTTRRGYGDTTFRLKYNFWGNDNGRTAFAATPYVKFPTSQEHIGNHNILLQKENIVARSKAQTGAVLCSDVEAITTSQLTHSCSTSLNKRN